MQQSRSIYAQLRAGKMLIYLLLPLVMLVACSLQPPEIEPVEIRATEEPVVENDSPLDNTVVGGQELTLVVWAPSFFVHSEEGAENNALAAAYSAFTEANPDVELIVQPKAETGRSSLPSYVKSASQVAPTILPDLLLVDTQRVWPLIEPFGIEPLSQEELGVHLDNAYPFAQNAVEYNEQIYGIPYAASIIHMVYASKEFQDESSEKQIPNSWPELLSSDTTYLFPAVGEDRTSSDMLLLQYVGAGGQLTADGAVVNPEALTALFNFMASGVEKGLFPISNREMSTDGAAWEAFAAEQSGMVNVRSEQFLSQQNLLTDTGFAAVPTRSGLAVTIGRVWAFVVMTNDPAKRMLALELTERLRDPQVHSAWSQYSRRLPTHMDALDGWIDNQPYYDFLRQQMDIALAVPNSEAFLKLSQKIQAAQLSVLDDEMSAPEAVNDVVNQE